MLREQEEGGSSDEGTRGRRLEGQGSRRKEVVVLKEQEEGGSGVEGAGGRR